MRIIHYTKKYHKEIIWACAQALKQGKSVAYPTDTSYGLAVDASNIAAIKKLYRVKGRNFKKPIHVIVPSMAYAKKIVKWNKISFRLAKKFWPGPLTLVLSIKYKVLRNKNLALLSAKTGFLGIRWPNNKIAQDLAKYLKKPITATSANPPNHLGGDDSYSAEEIVKQFQNKKHKPDIIINAGKLPRRKPSTMVKIDGDQITILRKGPVSGKQIRKLLGVSF